ncbi:MAG: hypothetical protein QM765_23245 [Myxococcales bacterium]
MALSPEAAKTGARGRMCILTPTPPFANTARNVTASTFDLLRVELRTRSSLAASPEGLPGLVRLEATESSEGWLSKNVLSLILDLERTHRVRPFPSKKALGLDSSPSATTRQACERFQASFENWAHRPEGAVLRLLVE